MSIHLCIDHWSMNKHTCIAYIQITHAYIYISSKAAAAIRYISSAACSSIHLSMHRLFIYTHTCTYRLHVGIYLYVPCGGTSRTVSPPSSPASGTGGRKAEAADFGASMRWNLACQVSKHVSK